MKLKAANKAVYTFIKQTIKNYKSMKIKLIKIFCLIAIMAIICTSCNVTRKVTTQASYFQSGDTTTTIVTKTTETYDASKKF